MSGLEPCVWYFSSFFRRYGNIQCIDCKNNHDLRTRSLMSQADLVVIPIHQDYRELCSLFCGNRIRFPNCVYLVVNYVPGDYLNLRRITFEFRIPSTHLACIPYSPRIRETKNWPGTVLLPTDVRREMDRAGQIMLLALGF